MGNNKKQDYSLKERLLKMLPIIRDIGKLSAKNPQMLKELKSKPKTDISISL